LVGGQAAHGDCPGNPSQLEVDHRHRVAEAAYKSSLSGPHDSDLAGSPAADLESPELVQVGSRQNGDSSQTSGT
jgi:hypothetical protein